MTERIDAAGRGTRATLHDRHLQYHRAHELSVLQAISFTPHTDFPPQLCFTEWSIGWTCLQTHYHFSLPTLRVRNSSALVCLRTTHPFMSMFTTVLQLRNALRLCPSPFFRFLTRCPCKMQSKLETNCFICALSAPDISRFAVAVMATECVRETEVSFHCAVLF